MEPRDAGGGGAGNGGNGGASGGSSGGGGGGGGQANSSDFVSILSLAGRDGHLVGIEEASSANGDVL